MGKPQPYGDLVELNAARLIVDAVGRQTLEAIVSDYLQDLGTSAAVYEKNGDYAAGMFTSGWCRFLDARSRELCGTADNREALASGRWHCHESCWAAASRPSMDARQPVDVACRGGIRVYAVPITARGEVVGSIKFGYGTPPQDASGLAEVAARYDVPVERLLQLAREYRPRSDEVVETAKRHLETTARLVGALVERALAERERDKSELFIGMLAHDLRSPLSAIAMSAQWIVRKAEGDPSHTVQSARRILESARRADRMISQILDFARARLGGGLPVVQRRVDVTDLVTRVVEELSAARPHRVIRLAAEPGCHAEIDPDRFGQILANLVANADEHGAPAAPVDVRLSTQGDLIRLEVHNEGPAIADELLARIFEPMRRGKRAGGTGLGLGLFIVKEIAAAHRGRVDVRSSSAGGTVFSVTVPRVAVRAPPAR